MNLRLPALLIFSSFITIAAFCYYFIIQPSFSYSVCPLCDGNQYLRMYNFFHGDTEMYDVVFPYYSRIFAPVFASMLPLKSALANFQLLNFIFSVLSTVAIVFIWRRLDIPFYLIAFGMVWLLLHWPGMIRLNAADPMTVDVLTYFIQALFILIFLSRQWFWLWILACVAVFQKESFNALLIALLIYSFIERKYHGEQIPLYHIIGPICLSFVLKFLFTLKSPPLEANDKNAIETIFLNCVSIIQDPLKLILRWPIAILTAFGPMLVLAILNIKEKYKSIPILDFLSIMSLTYLVLGLVAGGDMTRIIFLGFPFIMTWILFMLKEVDIRKTMLAFALSVAVMRLLEVIPDAGKDLALFNSWFPEYADIKLVLLWAVYFVFSFLFLFIINRFFKAK